MSFNLDGQDTKEGVLWEEFQTVHNINYGSNIKPKLSASDTKIIAHVGGELTRIMPELTTKFWGYHKKIRREAALDTELDELLGKEEIDYANQSLSDDMEVEEEDVMRSYVGKIIYDENEKTLRKGEIKATKKHFGPTPQTRSRRQQRMVEMENQKEKTEREGQMEVNKEIFQMLRRRHQNPWKMRPIVCCLGTLINYLSRWLNHWLQKLKPLLPTYIKNSTQLLQWFQDLGVLPHIAKIFTANANSMYTTIGTNHAIKVII